MKFRLTLLAAMPVLAYAAAPQRIHAGEPAEVGTETQLVVDDTLIAKRTGVVRKVHPCRKLPRPVIEPEKAWERKGVDERIYVYGTVLRDERAGLWRMWYNRGALVMLATSADDLRWDRPSLGLHERSGSRENNIVFPHLHSPSVIRDDRESDPAKRYKMLGSGSGKAAAMHGYCVAFSADGIGWQMYPKNPVLPGGDTCTLSQDPRTGEYLAFFKRTHAYRGHSRRLVYLATSRDMQQWSAPTLVMAPDEIDDKQTQAEGGRYSQFYNMSVFPYAGQFLGLVTHFRYSGSPAEEGPGQSPDDGPIDVQLVHSRDGRKWLRCEDRRPIIPNGPHDYDKGCILGVTNGPVVVGDELWLYYTAITTTHGGYLPKKRITIARAAWRRDGFVSLYAGAAGGELVTKPLVFEGRRLTVNACAPNGGVRVEIQDAEGKPLEGHQLADCREIRGDKVEHAVTWNRGSHVSSLAHKPVRLRFVLKEADLFAFRFIK